MEELIEAFVQRNSEPEAILVYRDGVPDSQYHLVLNFELPAFQNVISRLSNKHLGGKWQPKITYVVCQRRNASRFFPREGDRDAIDRSGNLKAGTIIDSTIVNPHLFSFHLLSHNGLQGTSRPGYYQVLVDEVCCCPP